MGQIINVDFGTLRKTAETVSDQPGWLPEPGKYSWKCEEAEVDVSATGNPVLRVLFSCLTGPGGAVDSRGKKLKYTMSLQPQALFTLAGFARACGLSGDDTAKLNTDMFIGKIVYATISHKEYNNKKTYSMDYFQASNGATA